MARHLAALALGSLMLSSCTHQQTTSSRISDTTPTGGAPTRSTPGGDHTGSDPSNPQNDVDNRPKRTGPSATVPTPP